MLSACTHESPRNVRFRANPTLSRRLCGADDRFDNLPRSALVRLPTHRATAVIVGSIVSSGSGIQIADASSPNGAARPSRPQIATQAQTIESSAACYAFSRDLAADAPSG